jgi:hypothetical protein
MERYATTGIGDDSDAEPISDCISPERERVRDLAAEYVSSMIHVLDF